MTARTLKEAYDILLEDESQYFVVCNSKKGLIVEEGKWLENDADNLTILPGSFNPVHEGHRFLLDSTKNKYTFSAFETSITKVDKPPVTLKQLEEVLSRFTTLEAVILTNAPRMIQKIAVLAGYNLVILCGTDTIKRMAQDYTMLGINGLCAHFKVMGREEDSWPLPGYKALPKNVSAVETPEHLKYISSTKIREGWKAKLNEASDSAIKAASNHIKEVKKTDAEFWNSLPPDVHNKVTK